jgi:hypothetical protein
VWHDGQAADQPAQGRERRVARRTSSAVRRCSSLCVRMMERYCGPTSLPAAPKVRHAARRESGQVAARRVGAALRVRLLPRVAHLDG